MQIVRVGLDASPSVLLPMRRPGVRFQILIAEGAETDADFLAARNEALAPLLAAVASGVEAGELSGAPNTAWLGMVIAGLLMTAVQAAAAGLIDPSEAGDLVADAFIDGFGTS